MTVLGAGWIALRGSDAPADRAAGLVPADALLYVHVSTDPDRTDDRRLVALARRLPALARLLTAYDGARRQLGDEVAFARLPEGDVLLLARPGGGFDRRGDPAAVARIGRGRSLADLPAFTRERPGDRVADAYVAPAAFPPALRVLAAPLTADATLTDDGLRVTARRAGEAHASFAPELLRAVAGDASAYLGLRGLAGVPLPELVAPLADVFDGELALSIGPPASRPTITLAARTGDPVRARATLAALQSDVAVALTGSGEQTGQLPVFEERDLGGIDGYALTLAGGGELVYAVQGTRIAVSSTEAGVRRGLRDADGLGEAETFRSANPSIPDRVEALAFVATSQLLELADEAGLDALAAYRTLRPSLARIRALGAVVRRQGDDTILELNLLIP